MDNLIPRLPRLAFGGDYNPEQWPEQVWTEDVRLMREAHVNLATTGVFSWAALEPVEGTFTFDWLDRILDKLAAGGVSVDLATATASPPPWFGHRYPQALPVDIDGRLLQHGSRQAYCPSSPIYRQLTARLVEQLATRYAGHPALVLWHVNNEYGCHVPRCYCDVSAEAFRGWLRGRYDDDLDRLNHAWGTSFWSQRYSDWEQVLPPRATPSFSNPGHMLDFRRFSSDELLDCYRLERDLLHRLSPGVPVTTNFMAGACWEIDYWQWAAEVDVVSNDNYLVGEGPETHIDLAFSADLSRSLAAGRPWLLMEHSTSAVNWQPRNLAKVPGQLARNSMAHVARGSEGALFFQWRQSEAGAEKWHSAMVPHAGTDTDVWREVVELGTLLDRLGEVLGGVPRAEVAIVLDYPSIWAQDHPAQPTVDLHPVDVIRQWHAVLWRAGVTVDFVHPEGDLTGYRLVLAPASYLVSDAGAANLTAYAAGGGVAVVGPYSGVVDTDDRVRLGGYPGAWRDLLGIRVQQYLPLPAGGTAPLSDGSTGVRWREDARADGASVLATYTEGPISGAAALTRRDHGDGAAWYLGTHLADDDLARLLARITEEAGVHPTVAAPVGVEAVRRTGGDGGSHLFLINHTADEVQIKATGTRIPDDTPVTGELTLAPGAVTIIRES